ncbi:MAG: SIS domain-containing protein [Sedimentisphaerales bacterium]|nr:SIS domain-containing protein [Sedimentisphaerales bacterium]
MKQIVIDTIATHNRLVAELAQNQVDTILAAARMIVDCIRSGGKVLVCGNGGSAADAQHIAGELIGRFLRERKAFPVIALTTDTSVITAVSNDYSYDSIFVRQVEGLFHPNDVLWAFSTSGTSRNVIIAAERAKQMQGKVLAFTGRPQSQLERLSDLCLAVDAPNSATAQEIHQLAYHIICNLVEKDLSEIQ